MLKIAHNGNRLRFGPEGNHGTTGDHRQGDVPQSPKLLEALYWGECRWVTILVQATKGFLISMYTYGHRNVQGIDFRPSDGRAFTAEHGHGKTMKSLL